VSVPLVPVTVTVNVPLLTVDGILTINVEEPWVEVVIDVGLSVAFNDPAETVRPTVPLKPLRAVTVIVAVLWDPLGMLRLVGDVEIEKS
jgi:hypothetical protein